MFLSISFRNFFDTVTGQLLLSFNHSRFFSSGRGAPVDTLFLSGGTICPLDALSLLWSSSLRSPLYPLRLLLLTPSLLVPLRLFLSLPLTLFKCPIPICTPIRPLSIRIDIQPVNVVLVVLCFSRIWISLGIHLLLTSSSPGQRRSCSWALHLGSSGILGARPRRDSLLLLWRRALTLELTQLGNMLTQLRNRLTQKLLVSLLVLLYKHIRLLHLVLEHLYLSDLQILLTINLINMTVGFGQVLPHLHHLLCELLNLILIQLCRILRQWHLTLCLYQLILHSFHLNFLFNFLLFEFIDLLETFLFLFLNLLLQFRYFSL